MTIIPALPAKRRFTCALGRHTEHHHSDRIGWLRAAVLGANDGIVSTAAAWAQPCPPMAAMPMPCWKSSGEKGWTTKHSRCVCKGKGSMLAPTPGTPCSRSSARSSSQTCQHSPEAPLTHVLGCMQVAAAVDIPKG